MRTIQRSRAALVLTLTLAGATAALPRTVRGQVPGTAGGDGPAVPASARLAPGADQDTVAVDTAGPGEARAFVLCEIVASVDRAVRACRAWTCGDCARVT